MGFVVDAGPQKPEGSFPGRLLVLVVVTRVVQFSFQHLQTLTHFCVRKYVAHRRCAKY